MSLNTEATAVCPYNKAHCIVLSRMQYHLTKCRIQHPCSKMAKCPFNATHLYNPIEMDWHLQWCPDRIAGDKMIYAIGTESPFVQAPPPIVSAPTVVSSNEVWGDEVISGESVLDKVKEVSLTKPNLMNKICAPKSERKAHKIQERRRFAEFDNQGKLNMSDTRTDRSDFKPAVGGAQEKTLTSPPPSVAQEVPFPSPSQQSVSSPQAQESWKQEKTNEYGVNNEEYPPMSSEPQRKRNPWGQPKPVNNSPNVASVSEANSSQQAWGGGRQAERPAWGQVNQASVDASTKVLQEMKLSERRDPGNPWKTRMAANFQGEVDKNDFPVLPMAGRGRGKRDN